jgi:hypothetical protein
VHEKFQRRANTRKGEIAALEQVAFDIVIRTYEPEDGPAAEPGAVRRRGPYKGVRWGSIGKSAQLMSRR